MATITDRSIRIQQQSQLRWLRAWTSLDDSGVRSMGDAGGGRGGRGRWEGGRESRRRKRRGEGGGGLALFYRKGLIALPITDNATINDLRVVGRGMEEGRKGQEGRGRVDREEGGTGMEIGTWPRMGMREWESGCGGGGRERWKEAIRAYIDRCTTHTG